MKFTPLAGIETISFAVVAARSLRMKFTPLAGIETPPILSHTSLHTMKFTPLAGIETFLRIF